MNIDINTLHKNVGLKFEDQVYFDKENVEVVIKKYKYIFSDLDLSPIDDSHMQYGYNKSGNPIKLGFEGNLINRIVLVSDDNNYRRFKGVIAYDGHRYNGFQTQKNLPTIQGELSRIITLVNNKETLVQGASRTDTGVHAINYTFHFDTDKLIPEEKWLELINHQLPNDISIKSIKEVHPLFHSRYDVYKKRYIYKINVGEVDPFNISYKWYTKDFNMSLLEENLKQLVGTHDFNSFCKGKPDDTVRTIFRASVNRDNNDIELIFEGNGFLRYMVRIIVKTLVEIASGKQKLSISEIIKEKSRANTKNLAPACGLYLEEIMY